MPKTARRIDEQQREIAELEKANAYLKSRLDSKDDIREKNYARNATNGGNTTHVRNGSVSTPVTSKSSPIRSSNAIVDTYSPTVYSDSSSSCDSSSSSDSGSCCCD